MCPPLQLAVCGCGVTLAATLCLLVTGCYRAIELAQPTPKAVMTGAAASTVVPAPVPPPATAHPIATHIAEVAQTSASQPLAHYYAALDALAAEHRGQVRILQLGDSHTAADLFTGRLRTLLQQRFGNAGRGMVPAGPVPPAIRMAELSVVRSGRWTVSNSLVAPNGGPYGPAGFVATSGSTNAALSARLAASAWFDHGFVEYLQNPTGGKLELLADGKSLKVASTAGPAGTLGRVTFHAQRATRLTVVAQRPGTRVLSWSFERDAPGVLFDNLGVVGATVNLINQWSSASVRATLQHSSPDLIIVAYGTNEAFAGDFDGVAYAASFTRALLTLRAAAPRASLLILGPPDAETAEKRCRQSSRPPSNCRWHTPPALRLVRDIQKQVAADQHAAFWDWSHVMMPEGGIGAWIRRDPPLARADHVHYTTDGYSRAADALFAWMIKDYEQQSVQPAAASRQRL